jgi:hypothetical protein
MDITFNMTPEQQAADDVRRATWDREQRQHIRTMPAAEYAALRAAATKPGRPAPIALGPHASTLDDAAYAAELRRVGVRATIRRR